MAYFVSSELKTTTEETTRQLYEDLEDAHAELALITSMRGKGAVRLAGSCSGSQSTGSGIEGKRRCFQTTSSEEDNSDQGATPLSNGGEGVSPTTFRRLMTAADDVRDQHSEEEEVPCNDAEADCAEQVWNHEFVTTWKNRSRRCILIFSTTIYVVPCLLHNGVLRM